MSYQKLIIVNALLTNHHEEVRVFEKHEILHMILNICYKYSTSHEDHLIHDAQSSDAELMMIYVCKCVIINICYQNSK